jgi:hypothetical protein
MKIIDILQKIIKEGSDPTNADSYPSHDEWTMKDWQTFYNALVKKWKDVNKAKTQFLRYWEPIYHSLLDEPAQDELNDETTGFKQWFREREMWNGVENRPYLQKEFEDVLKYVEFVKNDSKKTEINKEDLNEVISCSGYGKDTPEFKFAKIIATKEGWVKNLNNGKGSRSYRNNNPGNLDYYDGLKSIDSNVQREKKSDGKEGRFAKFSSPCLGSKALIEDKIKKWSKGFMPDYGSAPGYDKGEIPTLKQFMYTYAPPNENDTTKYINDILKSLGNEEFTPDTSMAKIIKI